VEFEKRLWLARWAGDEQTVRTVAEKLGAAAEANGDAILQENLFEAQLTATAAEGLAEGGIGEALATFRAEVSGRLRGATQYAKHREFVEAVSGRIEKRLKELQRQLEFKERKRRASGKTANGEPLLLPAPRTELFVEERREQQQRDRFPGGRFWRIGHHPHGLELRSYISTRSWVGPEDVCAALKGRGFEDVTIGQRTALLRAKGELFAIHADSRVHCIARDLKREEIVPLLNAISWAIDTLWVGAQ